MPDINLMDDGTLKLAPPDIYVPPGMQKSGNGWTPGPSSSNGGCPGCSSKRSFSPNLSNRMYNSVQSWYDVPVQQTIDPRILIANAQIGVTQGTFFRSTNFGNSGTWIASPFALQGIVTCTSLHSDDQLTVADAAQWNFSHQGGNFIGTVPPPLRKLLFLRAGPEWEMAIPINLGAGTYNDLQLSFRDNAAVYGTFTGAPTGGIPVILFSAGQTGVVTLKVSLKMTGTFVMAISARDTVPNASLFEMEWNIVA